MVDVAGQLLPSPPTRCSSCILPTFCFYLVSALPRASSKISPHLKYVPRQPNSVTPSRLAVCSQCLSPFPSARVWCPCRSWSWLSEDWTLSVHCPCPAIRPNKEQHTGCWKVLGKGLLKDWASEGKTPVWPRSDSNIEKPHAPLTLKSCTHRWASLHSAFSGSTEVHLILKFPTGLDFYF